MHNCLPRVNSTRRRRRLKGWWQGKKCVYMGKGGGRSQGKKMGSLHVFSIYCMRQKSSEKVNTLRHAEAKRRTLRESNLIQISKNNSFCSFSLGWTHIKFDVWLGLKLFLFVARPWCFDTRIFRTVQFIRIIGKSVNQNLRHSVGSSRLISQARGSWVNTWRAGRIGVWKCWFYGRKTGVPWEKPSGQGRESTTNLTHIWHRDWERHRDWESNPGHIGGRRVLSPRTIPAPLNWFLVQTF